MFKRLHLLVIKSYIGPLILTFFIAEFVLIMHFLWLYISDLVGKGLEWSIIAELLLYASAGLVKMALPLAILLSSIMTFGNFGENFELSAMKSAGISLQRIMLPLIIFSVMLSFGSFFWSNNIIPYTNLKTGSLLYDVANQRPELSIKTGVFNKDIEGYSIKVARKNPNSPMMYDFMIYDHREKRGNPKVTLADSGKMETTDNQKYMIITLYGGRTFEEMPEKNRQNRIYPERHETFDKQTIIMELTGFELERTDESLFKHNYQMKTISQLEYSSDSLKEKLQTRKTEYIEGLHRSRYFKFDNPKPNREDSEVSGKNDSVIPKKVATQRREKLPDIDKAFASLTVPDKELIYKTALENAQNAKAFIESNINDINERKKNINKHNIAWHEKFTLSFACLIFFFIGAPLGAIIRKGGFGLPFLVSIIFFLIYYVVSISGRKLVEESVLLPWQGMWLSSLMALPLGIIFTYKATTDSVLFDITAYLDLIKRPFKILQIQLKDPSIVFHKNVEMPDDADIQSLLIEMEIILRNVGSNIQKKNTGFKNIYYGNFVKDQSSLKQMTEKYNLLYDILSVKYRDRIFLRVSLEKFPKIEFSMYEISSKRRKINLLLMTILFFPVGLYLVLRSYLKNKVLKQKIDMILENIVNFKDAPEHV